MLIIIKNNIASTKSQLLKFLIAENLFFSKFKILFCHFLNHYNISFIYQIT